MAFCPEDYVILVEGRWASYDCTLEALGIQDGAVLDMFPVRTGSSSGPCYVDLSITGRFCPHTCGRRVHTLHTPCTCPSADMHDELQLCHTLPEAALAPKHECQPAMPQPVWANADRCLDLSKTAPKWRSCSRGLNVEGLCTAPACPAKDDVVIDCKVRCA